MAGFDQSLFNELLEAVPDGVRHPRLPLGPVGEENLELELHLPADLGRAHR